MNGRKYHQAHREPSPWLVALQGVIVVALFVLVLLAASLSDIG